MARLFISHSSANSGAAIALAQWLSEQGFDDVILDIDPDRGLNLGERWQDALKAAADRCEAVLFLVSPTWLESKWCVAEFLLAKSLHKRIFGLIVEPVPFERHAADQKNIAVGRRASLYPFVLLWRRHRALSQSCAVTERWKPWVDVKLVRALPIQHRPRISIPQGQRRAVLHLFQRETRSNAGDAGNPRQILDQEAFIG